MILSAEAEESRLARRHGFVPVLSHALRLETGGCEVLGSFSRVSRERDSVDRGSPARGRFREGLLSASTFRSPLSRIIGRSPPLSSASSLARFDRLFCGEGLRGFHPGGFLAVAFRLEVVLVSASSGSEGFDWLGLAAVIRSRGDNVKPSSRLPIRSPCWGELGVRAAGFCP